MKFYYIILISLHLQCVEMRERYLLPVASQGDFYDFNITDLLNDNINNIGSTKVYAASKILNVDHIVHESVFVYECSYKIIEQKCSCHFWDTPTYTLHYQLTKFPDSENVTLEECASQRAAHPIPIEPCNCYKFIPIDRTATYYGYESKLVPAYIDTLTDVMTVEHQDGVINYLNFTSSNVHMSEHTMWKMQIGSTAMCRLPDRSAIDVFEYTFDDKQVYSILYGDRTIRSDEICIVAGCNNNVYHELANFGLYLIKDLHRNFKTCGNVSVSSMTYQNLEMNLEVMEDVNRKQFAIQKIINHENVTFFDFLVYHPTSVGWHNVYNMETNGQMRTGVAFYDDCYWNNDKDRKFFVCNSMPNQELKIDLIFPECHNNHMFKCGPNGNVLDMYNIFVRPKNYTILNIESFHVSIDKTEFDFVLDENKTLNDNLTEHSTNDEEQFEKTDEVDTSFLSDAANYVAEKFNNFWDWFADLKFYAKFAFFAVISIIILLLVLKVFQVCFPGGIKSILSKNCCKFSICCCCRRRHRRLDGENGDNNNEQYETVEMVPITRRGGGGDGGSGGEPSYLQPIEISFPAPILPPRPVPLSTIVSVPAVPLLRPAETSAASSSSVPTINTQNVAHGKPQVPTKPTPKQMRRKKRDISAPIPITQQQEQQQTDDSQKPKKSDESPAAASSSVLIAPQLVLPPSLVVPHKKQKPPTKSNRPTRSAPRKLDAEYQDRLIDDILSWNDEEVTIYKDHPRENQRKPSQQW